MMKCSRLNTMETFKNGFSIERDGKVYTLTEEEMSDFRFLDNAVDGQSYLDVYHNDADEDEADVIAQANDTEFGLAAYFYARDLSRVFRVGEALEYGIVGINTGIISNEVAPFGGIKASGLGREGSKYGIEDYLEIKYMCIGL